MEHLVDFDTQGWWVFIKKRSVSTSPRWVHKGRKMLMKKISRTFIAPWGAQAYLLFTVKIPTLKGWNPSLVIHSVTHRLLCKRAREAPNPLQGENRLYASRFLLCPNSDHPKAISPPKPCRISKGNLSPVGFGFVSRHAVSLLTDPTAGPVRELQMLHGSTLLLPHA
jgi:hypothetical protein